MKKFIILFTITLFAFINVQGQVTGDFQSNTIGSTTWADYTTWQVYNGTSWIPATPGQMPTSASNVTILTGDVRMVTAAATCKNLTVIGSLTLNTNSFTLNGDLTINGTFSLNGYITLNVAGNLIVNGTYTNNGTLNVTGKTTVNGSLSLGYYNASTFTGNVTVIGTFTLNSYNIYLRGSLVNAGTINGDAGVNSSMTFNGTTQQVLKDSASGAFINNNLQNLIINNTSGANPSVDLQVSLSVSSNITLTNGILGTTSAAVLTLGRAASTTTLSVNRGEGSFGSTFVPATNFNYNLTGITSSTVQYNSTVVHSINTGAELPTGPFTTLMINTLATIILGQSVSCTSMTMYAGVIQTTSTNSITITGTTAGSVFQSSTTSYVKGPLTRTIPSGLSGTSNDYKFPVGKNASWLFEFANINTTGSGNALITAEAFDAGPYAGTAGIGLGSVETSKYWVLTASMGSVIISSSTTVRLNDPSAAATNKVAECNTFSGTYNTMGGTFATGAITSFKTIDFSTISTGTFFRLGNKGGTFAAGIYAIGPNGPYAGYLATYSSFQNAVNAVADIPVGGNIIFEFQPDYVSTIEAYPITVLPSVIGTSTGSITFRPATSVSATINFSFNSTVLIMNGCSYVNIDGRNGGTGSNKFLQFTNSSTTTQTVDVKADAVNNQIMYCSLAGAVTSTTLGILTISSGSAIGEDNTLIDHCNFNGQGTTANCLYATGSSVAVNDNVVISNNNFYDYRAAQAIGLNIQNYNNTWTINGNSFYQTTAYTGATGTIYGINTANGSANGQFAIYGNYIGGNAPNCGGVWTLNSTALVYNFVGMYLNLSTTTTSKVYNNVITNFSWSSKPGTWTGISVIGGNVNIGTDGGNQIGSNTGNGAITITYNTTAGSANFYGINTSIASAASNVRIENNMIGSITTAATLTTIGGSITAINSSSTSSIIRNNIIGSTTTTSSLNASIASTTAVIQSVTGINCLTTANVTVNLNTIANFNNAMFLSGSASGLNRGIKIGSVNSAISPTVLVVDSNQIYSIYSNQQMIGVLASYAENIAGLDIQAATATNVNISKNTIYDLSNTFSTAAAVINVVGIYAYLGPGIYNIIDRNLIHSLNTASSSAVQYGFYLASGLCTFQNNGIRLGIDKNGAAITSTVTIYGISKSTGTAGSCNFWFNTVYIGGTGVATGVAPTYAYYQSGHTTEDIRDNIFINVRTRTTATLTNFAAYYLSASTSNFTSDYNIYYVTATDGVLAYIAANQTTMKLLRVALPGNDLHSALGNPALASPTTAVASMSLNLTNSSAAEGTGILLSGILIDLPGNVRSASTPTDIGCYAGNFTAPGAGQDIFSPVITYTLITNSSITGTGIRIMTSFATITDQVAGINNVTGTKPRLYYKKSTDANAFAANTSAGNGWKYVEATNSSSPYTFSINYALLRTAAAVGNIIQYYVVAQDNATTPNVTFNPLAGSVGTTVGTTGMTAPTTPNSYTIVASLPTAISVGIGQTYTTLTGATGVFNAINTSALSGNTVVTVVSDITEPGTVALNVIAHEEVAGVTLTIKSDGTARTLSGTTTTPMIGFNGPTLVTIDGGASKLLTFRNNNSTASTTAAVFSFYNGALKDTIKNCYIESNETSAVTGSILLGAAPASKIDVSNSDIRNASVVPVGSPTNCIFSNTSGNVIYSNNNKFYNWTGYGINLNSAGDSCVVNGNSFYMTGATSTVQVAVNLIGGNVEVITGNYVGGSAASANGSAWTTSGSLTPFNLQLGSLYNSTIQNNVVTNISSTGAFTGFALSGMFNFIGNTVGSATTANSIMLNNTSNPTYYGIYETSGASTNNFAQNTIANITLTMTSGNPNIDAMYLDNGNVKKNKIYNVSLQAALTGLGAYISIVGIYDATGSAAKEYSNNMISLGTGANMTADIQGVLETSTSSNVNFYYNSIVIYGSGSFGSLNGCQPLKFGLQYSVYVPYNIKNNILVLLRTGGTNSYAINNAAFNNAPIVSDYNDLYVYRDATNTANYIGYGPSNPDINLAQWQGTGHDLNSISVLPTFVNNANDLHIISDINIANRGTAVSVTDDIDGVTRCPYPDLGINQFSTCVTPKFLNLNFYLESLYNINGFMNQAQGASGNQYSGSTADRVTVELHNSTTYATLVASFPNVNVSTSGFATLNVPSTYSGTYYITIVPRNGIATVSAVPVSFAGSSISYNFTTAATQAYGKNEKFLNSGQSYANAVYGIYAGDVNSDGVVDVLDLASVQNDAILFSTGYLLTDVNGDGSVDAFDLNMVQNNSLLFISSITP